MSRRLPTRSSSRLQPRDPAEDHDVHEQSLAEEASNALDEARMVLPGIQALFGFQLIATFNDRFADLDLVLRELHLASIVLVTVAIALIMTPAAYHRIAERGRVTRSFITLTSWLLAVAMLLLALAISIDVYVVSRAAVEDGAVGMAIAVALLAIFMTFWIIMPLLRRPGRPPRQS